jgi:cation transport ATPase
MKFALVCLMSLVPAVAQLRTVEIRVSGLDCASCAGSVDRRLGRMRGVESASFDAAKNVATVKLKPENTVTLSAIRDALKSLGYTPEEANITVEGELRDGALSMKHQERAFVVEGARETGVVVVEGTVAASSDRLKARIMRRQ